MDKKPLIVCAVVLLVLGSSIPVLANEEKPDLIVEDLLIFPGHFPDEEEFRVRVKNIGNASTPTDKFIDITIIVRWKIFSVLPLIPVRKFTGSSAFNIAS